MAENGPREQIAKVVSDQLLSFFKWHQYGPCDQDFPCRHEECHKPKDKKQAHTHPVDVVFGYRDPYTNKNVLLNTDLKSYGEGSINPRSIETALISLSRTIDCAENSSEWQEKYAVPHGDFEVRGLLFVYNHDNKQQEEFKNFFYPQIRSKQKGRPHKPVDLTAINLSEGKQIHFIEPMLINYLMSITADINEMIRLKTFPSQGEYGFYYPDLTFHKVSSSETYYPATVELLSSPFMIVKHDSVFEYNRAKKEEEKKYKEGYVIYYNRKAETDTEFLYLLDLLSKYQILRGDSKIRIRVLQSNATARAKSHFKRAIDKYAYEWGYDDDRKNRLNEIELQLISHCRSFYTSENIGWKCTDGV
ncbi:TPA: hypothetical protein RQJ86_002189 [Vibrio vulnificus]|nr:hypothetical protein [Vibrio vulnificus]HDY7642449.1 hypothetical protein [Vibrio vulnificus]